MVTSTVFETLIDLAIQESDEAAKRLGQAVQSSQQAQEKLDLLESYQGDYAAQLADRLAAGLTVQQHRNYQEFIQGLGRAVSQQRQTCLSCQEAAARELELWRDCERKRLSFETLEQRQTREIQRRHGKLEQKQTDEHASRPRRNLH
jgi:flagellar FliJ protein